MMEDIIIVGGGPAGMMAAIKAREAFGDINKKILLIEHNEKLGKKLFITGKGRCNVTNACDTELLFNNILKNSKFMYSAVYGFDNHQLMDFFEKEGLHLKIERGERVFPVSDHSSDVIRALVRRLDKDKIDVHLNEHVTEISKDVENDCFIINTKKKSYTSKALIMATGGISYQQTGSDGTGHEMLKKTGHTITELRPSLVPFICSEEYVKELQGLSLKNIKVTISNSKKKLFSEEGEMLFTHFGVSGPLILSASGVVNEALKKEQLSLKIDLKMALTKEQLDKRILRDFEKNINKNIENALTELYPQRLIPVVLYIADIDQYKKVHDVTAAERERLVQATKEFPLTITGLRDFNEAIITRGGVSVKEINPSTMESKMVAGLYCAGELLDVDAKTGGFNLQIAFSSGALAGMSAALRSE